MSKTIITYGTFSFLHHGHIRLLRKAKKMGDYLIVGLSTDNFNKIKGKTCLQTYKQRKEVLEGIKYIDKIIPEKNWSQKAKDIKKYKAQMVMGSDWEDKFDEYGCIYLPRTKGISTTILRKGYEIQGIKIST
jgi:glycerol-3-phosphate cytidylyltransferase